MCNFKSALLLSLFSSVGSVFALSDLGASCLATPEIRYSCVYLWKSNNGSATVWARDDFEPTNPLQYNQSYKEICTTETGLYFDWWLTPDNPLAVKSLQDVCKNSGGVVLKVTAKTYPNGVKVKHIPVTTEYQNVRRYCIFDSGINSGRNTYKALIFEYAPGNAYVNSIPDLSVSKSTAKVDVKVSLQDFTSTNQPDPSKSFIKASGSVPVWIDTIGGDKYVRPVDVLIDSFTANTNSSDNSIKHGDVFQISRNKDQTWTIQQNNNVLTSAAKCVSPEVVNAANTHIYRTKGKDPAWFDVLSIIIQ